MLKKVTSTNRSLSGRLISALLGFALVMVWFSAPNLSAAQGQPQAREYDVKATLLFNFSQFVAWPKSALAETNAPFVIGVLGTDPFGKILDDLVKNERAYGRSIEVRRFRKLEEASAVHILFVAKSELGNAEAIVTAMKDKAVLLVGEERQFAKQGGGVAFAKEKDNIRLCVNPDAAQAAGLTVSAKLLQVAEIVHTEKK